MGGKIVLMKQKSSDSPDARGVPMYQEDHDAAASPLFGITVMLIIAGYFVFLWYRG